MPARSNSDARRCLARSRGSKRWTRTFVSTSAATDVEVLASPAPIAGPLLALRTPTFLLSLGGGVEEREPQRGRHRFVAVTTRRCDANGLASRRPVEVVAGADAVLVRQTPGD